MSDNLKTAISYLSLVWYGFVCCRFGFGGPRWLRMNYKSVFGFIKRHINLISFYGRCMKIEMKEKKCFISLNKRYEFGPAEMINIKINDICNKFGDEIYAEKKITLPKIDNSPPQFLRIFCWKGKGNFINHWNYSTMKKVRQKCHNTPYHLVPLAVAWWCIIWNDTKWNFSNKIRI